MKELFLAFIVGLAVGCIFKLLRLPLPAPPVLPGVLGIVGIYLGGMLVQRILELWR
ncbi:XapX domain-containing protein [Paenibacillus tarimensis]